MPERFEVAPQRFVTSGSRGDLSIAELPSGHVEYCNVVRVGVRIHSGNDVEGSLGLSDFDYGCCHDEAVPSW